MVSPIFHRVFAALPFFALAVPIHVDLAAEITGAQL